MHRRLPLSIHAIRQLPLEQRTAMLASIAALPEDERDAILNDWHFWARDNQLPPPGDWFVWLMMAGRGAGKLLCVDTPIPTPGGWTRNGDLAIGDEVFDEAGRVCRVTGIHDDPEPPSAYRVTFSDGQTIDACGDHQWVTWTHADRKQMLRSEKATRFPDNWTTWRSTHSDGGPRIRTTSEILSTLRHSGRGDLNHCIPQTGPLQTEERRLPIPPYALGFWLGDGSSMSGDVHKHQDDIPFVRAQFEADGYETRSRSWHQTFSVIGLVPGLRAAGVLGNKHVPLEYLRASQAQRLALLQGLMDSDGGVEHGSQVCFSSKRPELADAVEELAVSMGFRVTRNTKRAMLYGVDHGLSHRVFFTPTIQVFRLPRKADRLRFDGNQSLRRHHRMITAVEPIPTKPMRCISVDSPSRMYLAGRGMIPTHNTRTAAEWVLDEVINGRRRNLALVGQDAGRIRAVMIDGPSGIRTIAPPEWRPRHLKTEKKLVFPNGAEAHTYSARDPDDSLGGNHDGAWCDELAAWMNIESTWDMLVMGLRIDGPKGDPPRALVTTTPRPVKLLKKLIKDPDTVVTGGTTDDNADHLSSKFLNYIYTQYRNTRLGEQELKGMLLEEVDGALWTLERLAETRTADAPTDLARIVVAVDPMAGAKLTEKRRQWPPETGIVIAGATAHAEPELYVLGDYSAHGSPEVWANRAIAAYEDFGADAIVAEKNQGGDMVEDVMRTRGFTGKIELVHATRGKRTRAEPVSMLWEQGRGHIVGVMTDLENQLTNWTGADGEESPDRLDALVWAGFALVVSAEKPQLTPDLSINAGFFRPR
jgi:phage terminase large subunit-like protein